MGKTSTDNVVALKYLAMYDWGSRSWDYCWLDCPRMGVKRTWDGKVICLCPQHAMVLQRGYLNGSYLGAPLPPGTLATRWPWREEWETG